MLGTALLVFREVLEAALIISVVCAATHGVLSRTRWIVSGIGVGVLGAAVVAFFAGAIANMVSGMGQEVFNAGVLLAAVVMIAWHAIWMASHGKQIVAHMKSIGGAVAVGSRPLSVLLIVVAIAVLREGSEVVLFLYGQAASGSSLPQLTAGIATGLIAGSAIGLALYLGLLRIPMRYFFSTTNGLLVLLAAGMASSAAHYLIQADLLPTLGHQIWDTSTFISSQSLLGQTLHTLIGYDDRPSGMQLVFYAITATLIALGMKLWGGSVKAPALQTATV